MKKVRLGFNSGFETKNKLKVKWLDINLGIDIDLSFLLNKFDLTGGFYPFKSIFIFKFILLICILNGFSILTGCDSSKSNKAQDQGTTNGNQFGKIKIFSSSGESSVEWVWGNPIEARVPLKASCLLKKKNDEVPTTASITDIDPWMPSMGHGTFREDQRIETIPGSPNEFLIEGIYFTMGGPWEVRVFASVEEKNEEFFFNIDVP